MGNNHLSTLRHWLPLKMHISKKLESKVMWNLSSSTPVWNRGVSLAVPNIHLGISPVLCEYFLIFSFFYFISICSFHLNKFCILHLDKLKLFSERKIGSIRKMILKLMYVILFSNNRNICDMWFSLWFRKLRQHLKCQYPIQVSNWVLIIVL